MTMTDLTARARLVTYLQQAGLSTARAEANIQALLDEQPAAVSVPPPADQTALRAAVIDALYEARRAGLGGMSEAAAVAHMADAVLAVLPEQTDRGAEMERMRERHKASLRRADQLNNELMEEVQRYAAGTERPVLWSVYNRMHGRALEAEAKWKRLVAYRDALENARRITRTLAAHAVGFQDVLDDSDRDPWARMVRADIAALSAALAEPSQGAEDSECEAEAELYVLLRKAGEDRRAAQALIDRHRAEVLRRVAAEEQPAAGCWCGHPQDRHWAGSTRMTFPDGCHDCRGWTGAHAYGQELPWADDKPDAAQPAVGEQPAESAEDPARIDKIRPEFTEHASVESIDVQLRRARAQQRRWHLRVEWLISLRQARVEQKGRGEWPAVGEQPETPTQCGPAPDECDAEAGDPCANHERKAAHAEGEHAFCGPECDAP